MNDAKTPATTSGPASVALLDKTMTWTPIGGDEEIIMSVSMAMRFLVPKTKSGKTISEADALKFCMLWKNRRLNPWEGDCFVVGYDGKDGPEFSCITAYAAFLKRAELHPAYDGIEGGITISDKDGNLTHREGDLLMAGEQLVGAWARVYRKDHAIQTFESISRHAYEKQTPFWSKDPSGMLVKCAKAKALREAFPTQIGGLFMAEELDLGAQRTPQAKQPRLRSVAEAIGTQSTTAKTAPAIEAMQVAATEAVDGESNVGG